MQITKINKQKSRNRYNVFVDGSYSFSVSEDTFSKYSLSKGLDLTSTLYAEVIQEEYYQKLKFKLLNYLSSKPRTEKEVRDKAIHYLYKMEAPQDSYESLLVRAFHFLNDLHLLDDEYYTKRFIEEHLNSKKFLSKKAITNKLYKRGIARGLVEKHISVYNADVEQNNANLLVRKKLKSIKDTDVMVQKQKIWRYMSAKGYDYDTINKAINTEIK